MPSSDSKSHATHRRYICAVSVGPKPPVLHAGKDSAKREVRHAGACDRRTVLLTDSAPCRQCALRHLGHQDRDVIGRARREGIEQGVAGLAYRQRADSAEGAGQLGHARA